MWEHRLDGLSLDVTSRHGRPHLVVRHLEEDTAPRIRCDGARVTWNARKDLIRVSAPQSCYRSNTPRSWTFLASSELDGEYDSPSYQRRLTLARGPQGHSGGGHSGGGGPL
jgi:hypothetical protein